MGIDATLAGLAAALAVLCALAWARGGSDLLLSGLGDGVGLLVHFALVIVVAFLIAGLAEKVVPHELVRGALGEEAGLRGIVLATLAGAITPSGPFVSMPIAATLLRSGAGTAAVVAYVSAWALLALHRFVAWEIPILGLRFALLRYAVCIALPILAGLAVRLVTRS